MPAATSPTPSTIRAVVIAALASSTLALLVGALTGLAGRQLYVIGLWELFAGWALSFSSVSLCHLLLVRSSAAHVGIAVVVGFGWLGGFHIADAWGFWHEQVALVADRGLLLADQAVLRDTGDPSQLVDFSLLGETGATGLLGASKLLLQRGLTVHRALGVSHIVAIPPLAHAAVYGAQAALVALLVGRSLQSLLSIPTCARCGSWMRQQLRGHVPAELADHARQAWLLGDPVRPDVFEIARSGSDLLLTEDHCPRGCSATPGWTLARRRGLSLSARKPGVFATWPPTVTAADDPAG